MKNALFKVCCILLALVCVFGLVAGVVGVKDILNIKEYKTKDSEIANDGIAQARDAIALLAENEETYSNGVGQYEAGLIQYSQGKQQLASAAQQLADGEKALNDGKKQLADNKQAYEEGKEKLAKIEPLMPYVNALIALRDAQESVNDAILGIADQFLGGSGTLPAWAKTNRTTFRSYIVSLVKPLAANLGLDIPDDADGILNFVQTMVADGQAQIKMYEDGMKQVAEGEPVLEAGKKAYAEGKAKLSAASGQLADADVKLGTFEGGEAQLAAGLMQIMDGMQAVDTPKGKHCVDGLAERLGPDFSIWLKDENGEIVVKRGCQFLDLNSCSLLLDKAEEYLADAGDDTYGELYPRVAIVGLMVVASIIGLIASIVGLAGKKKTGFVAGIVVVVLTVAAHITGFVIGYADYAYGTKVIGADGVGIDPQAYSGNLELAALILLTGLAILFVILAAIARKGAAAAEAAEQAEFVAAAPAVDAEQLADLQAENEALKEMVANLAADAATVQE